MDDGHVFIGVLRRVPAADEADLGISLVEAGGRRYDVIAHILGP